MLMSSVTHEYLTPVRCIFNFSNMLLPTASSSQLKSVKMIKNTSSLLLSQINMTLDGNLIDHGKFQPILS